MFSARLALRSQPARFPVTGLRVNVSLKPRFYSTTPSIELIKQLRKETKAGIADCRDALEASNNDMEEAKNWLVARAKITAAKKSGRLAQEGEIIFKLFFFAPFLL